ncbi:MAG: hypothetical protein GY839_14375 [candidate division Zixibacteria bacterium]|nr:hypothetical protein [candidate division Zixibacteria bacterium]
MIRIFSIVILAILSANSFGQPKENQADYPAWFLYPPVNKHSNSTVGFLQPCLDNDSSVAMAKSDGIWNILSQSRNKVTAKAGLTGIDSRLLYVGQRPQFVIDSLGYDGISNDFAVFDKFYGKKDYLMVVLVGPKSDSANFDNDYEKEDFGDWIHTIPGDGKYLYALGSAPKYYYQSSSWKRALENALVDLTHQISTEIKSLYKFEAQNVYKTVMEEGEVVLKNWRIVARKYDSSSQTYNVLIRMPIN